MNASGWWGAGLRPVRLVSPEGVGSLAKLSSLRPWGLAAQGVGFCSLLDTVTVTVKLSGQRAPPANLFLVCLDQGSYR